MKAQPKQIKIISLLFSSINKRSSRLGLFYVISCCLLPTDSSGKFTLTPVFIFSTMAKAKFKGNKRKPEYDLETKQPFLKKHKKISKETTKGLADSLQQNDLLETNSDQANLISVKEAAVRKKTLFVANLNYETKIPNIIDFFKKVGRVVRVRLIVNHEGKHVGYGFVEFASAKLTKKALENKNGEYLHNHKIFLDVAKTAPYPPRPKYNLAEKFCYEDYLRRESLPIEEEQTPPDFVEAVGVSTKTLFVAHLSRKTEISHIINFFKDVGEVVHVRLILNHNGKHLGCGFVEFGSANEAKKAYEKKNGENLNDCKIFLEVAKIAPYPPPKYCIDHKVWYEDYLRRESLLIEENEAVEGLDEPPVFVEEVAVRKKTLFIANLSHKTKISHIIKFFKDVGEVFRVRLIVNHRGEHVGCGFVEFASANEAKKALQKKNGENLRSQKIFLDVAELAPYPLRPKYNLAEKLWHERESLLKKQKASKLLSEKSEFCGTKIIFSYDDDDDEDD